MGLFLTAHLELDDYDANDYDDSSGERYLIFFVYIQILLLLCSDFEGV